MKTFSENRFCVVYLGFLYLQCIEFFWPPCRSSDIAELIHYQRNKRKFWSESGPADMSPWSSSRCKPVNKFTLRSRASFPPNMGNFTLIDHNKKFYPISGKAYSWFFSITPKPKPKQNVTTSTTQLWLQTVLVHSWRHSHTSPPPSNRTTCR